MNPNRSLSPRLFILTTVCALSLTLGTASAQEIVDGDFEGAFEPVVVQAGSKAKINGDIAKGWKDESSWAEVDVTYSQDANGHEKTSAQKIEVKSITAGGVQLAQDLILTPGSYTVTAWVRGENAGTATLMLRKAGDPYTVYGSVKVPVSSEWTEIEFPGNVTDNENTFVLFNPTEPGTYWIDDVTLKSN